MVVYMKFSFILRFQITAVLKRCIFKLNCNMKYSIIPIILSSFFDIHLLQFCAHQIICHNTSYKIDPYVSRMLSSSCVFRAWL